ncbi:TonB family protein [Oceanicaulis sp.]
MRFFSVLIVWLSATAMAIGQDEPLPDSVTTPYLAYEAAVEAGDDQAAAESSEQAWRAGRDARIAPSILATLAENAGFYARRTGRYDIAEDAFLNAAELNERSNGDAVVRARALRYASDAQLRQGEHRSAFLSSERGVEIIETLPASPAAETEAALAHAYMSSSRWARGQYQNAGFHGERAMQAARRAGIQTAPVFGVAAFQAGAYYSYEDRPLEAAYWMTVARTLLSQGGGDSDLSDAAEAWGSMERAELNADQRAELFERLLADNVYKSVDESEVEANAFVAVEGFVDTVVIERRPPAYPRDAAWAGVEGIALMRFDVNEEGRPENVEVVYSIPYREFGEEGVRTVRRWRYEPATQDGVPIVRRGVTTRLDYQLAD